MSKKPAHPPYLAKKLLSFMRRYSEEYSSGGDLVEEYREIAKERGKCTACLWYWWQVLYAIPTYILLQIEFGGTMFKNYFKIALRNMKKNKSFSFINIAGLAIGIACCMLILLYVGFEMSYDNYHKDVDRIYRIGIDINYPWEKRTFARTPLPLAPYLKENFPEVELAGRILPRGNMLIKNDDKIFYENEFVFVDKEIFDIFFIPFVKGNPENALVNPGTIVISEKIAHKYFGAQDPLGKTLNVNSTAFEITGVVKDPPLNTHFKYSFITSLNNTSFPYANMNQWRIVICLTYLKLVPNTNSGDLITRLMNEVLQGNIDSGETNNYFLQSIKDIHLSRSHLAAEIEPPSNPVYLYIFSAIAVLILIIASVNFINLSTARSAKRAKEIGIRKVAGASRMQLIRQFIGESLLTTILSVILALIISCAALPFFNRLVNLQLSGRDFLRFDFLTVLIFIILFSGIIAGCYPAFILSAFNPFSLYKGKWGKAAKGKNMRRILVSGQFTISIILIIGTIAIYKQVSYMKGHELGFSKEQKLVLPFRSVDISKNFETIKNEFLSHSAVTGATASSGVPGRVNYGASYRLLNEMENKGQQMATLFIDKDFVPEFEIKLVAGRSFLKETDSIEDVSSLINETAARSLGFHTPQDAVGKQLEGWAAKRIVGVVKDFHYGGLQNEIGPLVIANLSEYFRYISLTLLTKDISHTISFIQDKWKELLPGIPFEYFFLDEDFNRFYHSEEKTGTLTGIFSLLGVVVACLGLFGLSCFMAEQRTKEIAIRKIHGAQVPNIVSLQAKDFMKWIITSNIIAWPVAYFIVTKWLQSFAYRINISLGIFILSTSLALLMAIITISHQSIKAATANPVDSLRYE